MSTSDENGPTSINGSCECTIVTDSVHIPFKGETFDSMDTGNEDTLSAFQTGPLDYYSVTFYLAHGLGSGAHPITTGLVGVRASCSGEIGGNEFFFEAQSGTLTVNSINLAEHKIDATFNFESTNEQKAINGFINFTGAQAK